MKNKKQRRISIWVFSNNNSSKVFKFSFSFVKLSWLLIVLITSLSSVFTYRALRQEEPQYSTLISSTFPSLVLTDNKEVGKKVNTLADLIIRVGQYEEQLRHRAVAIASLLHDTKSLDYPAQDKLKIEKNAGGVYGIGGGDESFSPLFHLSSRTKGKEQSLLKNEPLEKNYPPDGLLDLLDSQINLLDKIPLGSPVEGMVSSPFGYRSSPFTGKLHMHDGIDILIEKESTVTATAEGVVVESGYKGSYGYTVIVDHGNGIETLYGHLSKLLVEAGTQVCRGEQLGLVGSSGRATGPHLHYELRLNGVARNPSIFIELANSLKFLS